jgi:hypothetical protein
MEGSRMGGREGGREEKLKWKEKGEGKDAKEHRA